MADSILSDIIQSGKEIATELKGAMQQQRVTGSLAKQSKKGTLQFPVVVERSISITDASMVTKALERQFVSFIRVVTSLNSVTKEADLPKYLQSLHQNYSFDESTIMVAEVSNADFATANKLNMVHEMNMSFSNLFSEDSILIEYADLSNSQRRHYFNKVASLTEGAKCVKTGKGLFLMESGMVSEVFLVEDAKGELTICKTLEVPEKFNFKIEKAEISEKNMKNVLMKESAEFVYPFNESCLNDFTKGTEVGIINGYRKPLLEADALPLSGNTPLLGNGNSSGSTRRSNFSGGNNRGNGSRSNFSRGNITGILNNNNNNNNNINVNVKTDSKEKGNKDPELVTRIHSRGDLMDNDAKKANELVPTMLRLVTNFTDKDGKIIRTEEYLIGVKAELHPVTTQSMIDNLVKGIKKNNTFFNFIKFTTGEISFFKDFVLTLNDIKSDIKTRFKEDKWWDILKNRKQKAKILGRIGMKQFLPNATIVVSQDVVNLIKQQHKIDFNQKKFVESLMSAYFLIAFVIVDPSTETCKFFFDGDKDFATYSYASLERENSNKAKEISNIMQILGKM